jgi:hypothetical protein
MSDDLLKAIRAEFPHVGVWTEEQTSERGLTVNVFARTSSDAPHEHIGKMTWVAYTYPLTVLSQMPGFRLSVTVKSPADWQRHLPYLLEGFQRYVAK